MLAGQSLAGYLFPLDRRVDIFVFRELFVLLHAWLFVEIFEWLRNSVNRQEKRAMVMVSITLALLAAGHFVAWMASRNQISIGVPGW